MCKSGNVWAVALRIEIEGKRGRSRDGGEHIRERSGLPRTYEHGLTPRGKRDKRKDSAGNLIRRCWGLVGFMRQHRSFRGEPLRTQNKRSFSWEHLPVCHGAWLREETVREYEMAKHPGAKCTQHPAAFLTTTVFAHVIS